MALTAWLALACLCTAQALRVGVGIADVTGPPAEIGFMGYAQLEQAGHGIHLRQFSRAFVLEDDTGNSTQRIVFVSVDAAMMGQGVRREVLKRLQKRYGDMYSDHNVIISGTHTHSTPGGFLMDFLFDLPILGFVKETYSAYILGIYKSIVLAHMQLTKARMEYGEAELLDANINRSPSSYLRNPPEERAKYSYDTDKTLAQVRFLTPDDKVIGVINWFAVHPTSMNNTNKLISSDNVGYASVLCEKALNGNTTLPGKGTVVCAFASTNLGDVSPNTKGPRCEFSGKPCDQEKKLCTLHKEKCFASGPGRDMFESTKIIATKLYDTAMKVLNQPGEDLTGPLAIVHQFVNMPEQEALAFDPVTETFNSSSKVHGCLPAMGYSFAAGTTDGPGAFDFTQGTTTSNPLWNAVRDFIAEPTDEDIKCQAPKPILLATGRLNSEIENAMPMPSTVCYICHCQLQKCYSFSQMAHKSNRILRDLFNSTEATYNLVTMLPRKIKENFSVTPTKYMCVSDYPDPECTSPTINEEQIEIIVKEEKTYYGTKDNEEFQTLNVDAEIAISDYPDTGSTSLIIKQEQIEIIVVKEEEKDIEEFQTLHEDAEIGNDLNNSELPSDNGIAKNYLGDKKSCFYCNVCKKRYANKSSLVRHLIIHTQNKQYSCNVCDKAFHRKETLINHMVIHSGEKPYPCNICDKAFYYKVNLKEHMHIHTGEKPYLCNICDKAFNRKASLKEHIQTHSGEKSYSCNRCDKAFKRSGNLKDHMQIHTGEKPYGCNQCDKAFKRKRALKDHMRIHSGEKSYFCNKCDKAFKRSGNLKDHMLIHTGEKPYPCNICDKAFNLKGTLRCHMRIHTGEKPYSCNICDKAFLRKGSLNNHMHIHTGEKPYSCNRCEKAFNRKSNLKEHMQTHSGEKSYSCNSCDKAFKRSGNLKDHMLIHSGEKPYGCNICDKAFNSKGNLKGHMRIHTDEKPYCCNKCHKAFIHNKSFKRHMLIHNE